MNNDQEQLIEKRVQPVEALRGTIAAFRKPV